MKSIDISSRGEKLYNDSITIYSSCPRNADVSNTHCHVFTQIIYILSGTLKHIVNGREYIQKPGSCVLVSPFTPHTMVRCPSDDTTLFCQINLNDRFLLDRGYRVFTYFTEYARFNNRFLPVFREFNESEKPQADEYIHSLLREYIPGNQASLNTIAEILAEFLQLCSTSPVKNNCSVAKKRASAIDASIQYIAEHISEKLTIDKLANVAMMSRRHYIKAFKEVTGTTVAEFILSVRLDKARREIGFSSMTLVEIAKSYGFYGNAHLSALFKKAYGQTPSEYRRYVANNSDIMEQHASIIRRDIANAAKQRKQSRKPL